MEICHLFDRSNPQSGEHSPRWPRFVQKRSQSRQRNSEMCYVFDMKSMWSFFFCFLEGINIIELPPFISQICWQLSSGMVAERRACERCGENWNLHRRGRDFSVHLQEKWRAVLWCLILSETLTDSGVGWATGVGTESICMLLPKKTKSFFFWRDCQGYLEVGLRGSAVFPAVRNTSLWTLPGG